MGKKIAGFFRGQIVTSIVYILLGAALTFVPVESVYVICKIVFGVMLIAAGALHILLYVLERPTTTMFDLFSGVILVVFGTFLFYNPQIIMRVLPTLLGGFVLVDSVWTLRGAFRLKKAGSGAWIWLLLGTIVFLVLGVVMIVNPFTVLKYMVVFCGCILLANGVLDLIFQFVLYRGLKNAQKNAGESAALETREESAEDPGKKKSDEFVYEEWNSRDTSAEDHNAAQPDEVISQDTAEPSAAPDPAENEPEVQEEPKYTAPVPELTLEPQLDLEEKDGESAE